MSIDFYPVRYDADQDIFRIPESARADLEAYSLNVSQANGVDLLDALGIDSSFGVKRLDEFSRLLVSARQADLKARKGETSPGIATTIDAGPGRMTMINFSRRPGYVEERLSQLAVIVQKARDFGATHISSG